MGRLVDEDDVKKIIDEELALRCGYEADIACLSIKKKIAELPTAYDVEKVVEEIGFRMAKDNVHHLTIGTIQNIVRKGGVE